MATKKAAKIPPFRIEEWRYLGADDVCLPTLAEMDYSWSRAYEFAWVTKNLEFPSLRLQGRKTPPRRTIDVGAGGDYQIHREGGEMLPQGTVRSNFPKPLWASDDLILDLRQPLPSDFRGVFDQVICISVLEHLAGDIEDHLAHLVELAKPGGRVVITMDAPPPGGAMPGLVSLKALRRFLPEPARPAAGPLLNGANTKAKPQPGINEGWHILALRVTRL